MNNILVNRFWIFTFIVLNLFNYKCKKESTDTFCKTQRNTFTSIDGKEGVIVYSSKYKRYGISIQTTFPNNIDSQIVGLLCNLSPDLQTVGLKVIVSGTLKNFNSNEGISPEIAGQDLRFLEVNQIHKK